MSHGLHAPTSRELGLEPRAARGQLAPARLRVDAALAARLPLEVLDRVRHVDRFPVDARLREGLVEHAAGRADERRSFPVLSVAGLLADEHRDRAPLAGAEHRLRRVLPQRAGAAPGGCLAELRERRPRGDQFGS